MKRIVTFSTEKDGRKRVQSISAPVNENKIDNLSNNMGFIDAGYTDPAPVEGKKIALYYNSDSELIEVEYSDIEFEAEIIAELRHKYPLKELLKLSGISRSTYYYYLKKKNKDKYVCEKQEIR